MSQTKYFLVSGEEWEKILPATKMSKLWACNLISSPECSEEGSATVQQASHAGNKLRCNAC